MVQEQRMSIPLLLLPAILLHGTFDFVLMVLGAVQYAYDLSEDVFNAISLAIGEVHTVLISHSQQRVLPRCYRCSMCIMCHRR